MRKLTLLLAAAVILGVAASASAQSRALSHWFKLTASTNDYNLLEGVALNATAALRTITLDIAAAENTKGETYTKVRVSVFFTYNAATTVTATPTCSVDGTNYASYTTSSCASGTCTKYAMVDSYTTGGADADLVFEYEVKGCQKVQVLFGGASAGASDLVDVQAVAISGS